MKRPGNPAGGGSSDDPGGVLLPADLGVGAGRAAGAVLRIFAAFGETEQLSPGRFVFVGCRMDDGLVWILYLPGGSAHWVSFWNVGRGNRMGGYFRQVAAAAFRVLLERSGKSRTLFVPSTKKILGFCEKCICIWGKMGYNKVYTFFEASPQRSPP